MNLSAVILAGGASRRMGRDKAWLEFEGQPLIVRALIKVRELGVEEIFISARTSGSYSALGGSVLLDQAPSCGPLGGLERGLAAATAPLLLVLAVDLPYMDTPFLRQMLAQVHGSMGVVPKVENHFEPLAAIYPKSCHALAQSLIQQSRYAAREFAETCWRHNLVQIYAVPTTDARCFVNWNSPQDMVQAGRGITRR